MEFHDLTSAQLEALAAGFGGAPLVAELYASRISINLLRFRNLLERWSGPAERLAPAVELLEEVQEARPDVYAELFGDPLVGAWLARADRSGPTERDFLEAGALAVAGALRAGLAGRANGFAENGRVVVPTLGAADADALPDGPTLIAADAGHRIPALPPYGYLRWQPCRRLEVRHGGLAASVRLDDLSRYRDGYHAPPSGRLSDKEAGDWQNLLTEAWNLLARYAPERAAEVGAGVRVLIPLVDKGDGSSRSGTSRESIGAVGMNRPSSPADFAVTLVHEFQHSKLSAVTDLEPLYRPDGRERHFAPWRRDRRPTSGLIQGVYAFLAVADTWLWLTSAPGLAEVAEREFAFIREDVRIGIDGLERSTELTPAGQTFVKGIRARLDEILAEPISVAMAARVLARRPLD